MLFTVVILPHQNLYTDLVQPLNHRVQWTSTGTYTLKIQQEYRSYSWDLLLAFLDNVWGGLQKEVVLLYFSCLFLNKWGRECGSHAWCMKLNPCSILVNSGIFSLMTIGNRVYELNRAVNVGAASWVKIQMTMRLWWGRYDFLCDKLECKR